MAKVVFEFDDPAMAEAFASWFSDGGGELSFSECWEGEHGSYPVIGYARCFEAWGYRPSMGHPTITMKPGPQKRSSGKSRKSAKSQN